MERGSSQVQPHVGVIVLGDIGRSPRMQWCTWKRKKWFFCTPAYTLASSLQPYARYHATSLAKHGHWLWELLVRYGSYHVAIQIEQPTTSHKFLECFGLSGCEVSLIGYAGVRLPVFSNSPTHPSQLLTPWEAQPTSAALPCFFLLSL